MDTDKMTTFAAGHVMRFIRNDGEPRQDLCFVELVEATDDEIELAFSLQRDRYYLRLRRDDVLRLLGVPAP